MIGAGGVGKTTLLHRLTRDEFIENMKITIGVDVCLYSVNIRGKKIILQLWDLGGQDRFRFMHDSYVNGAKAGILMYDLTRPETLDELSEWVEICRTNQSNLPIMLVGSKSDREEFIDTHPPIEVVKGVLQRFNLFDYVRISSKDDIGIKDCFEKIIYEIFRANPNLVTEIFAQSNNSEKGQTPINSNEKIKTEESISL